MASKPKTALGELENNPVRMVVVDNVGRLIDEQVFETGYGNYSIDASRWLNGIYNVSFYQNGQFMKTTRLVKE